MVKENSCSSESYQKFPTLQVLTVAKNSKYYSPKLRRDYRDRIAFLIRQRKRVFHPPHFNKNFSIFF